MFVGHIIFSADKTLSRSTRLFLGWLAGWLAGCLFHASCRQIFQHKLSAARLAAIPGGIMLAICALRPICGCGAALVLYDQYVARLRAAYPTGSHLGPRISRDTTTHFVSKPPAHPLSSKFRCFSSATLRQGDVRDSRSLSFQYCFTE